MSDPPEVVVEGESAVAVVQETPTGQSRLAYRRYALLLQIFAVAVAPRCT